jgi:hypothetical protein
MSKIFVALAVVALFAFSLGIACADQSTWTFVLHPADIVAGPNLQKLHSRHDWNWKFDERDGKFEVAVRKSAFPIPAPQCRMDYLILSMPLYYPENPKQAPLSERRAVYDALLAMQSTGKGTLSAHAEALHYVRQGPSGAELTTCNIYFVLPLAEDAGKLLP